MPAFITTVSAYSSLIIPTMIEINKKYPHLRYIDIIKITHLSLRHKRLSDIIKYYHKMSINPLTIARLIIMLASITQKIDDSLINYLSAEHIIKNTEKFIEPDVHFSPRIPKLSEIYITEIYDS